VTFLRQNTSLLVFLECFQIEETRILNLEAFVPILSDDGQFREVCYEIDLLCLSPKVVHWARLGGNPGF